MRNSDRISNNDAVSNKDLYKGGGEKIGEKDFKSVQDQIDSLSVKMSEKDILKQTARGH